MEKNRISIVNYGMGNIRSIQNVLDFVGVENKVIETPKDIVENEKLILPRVGSFIEAMKNIHSKDLFNALNDLV